MTNKAEQILTFKELGWRGSGYRPGADSGEHEYEPSDLIKSRECTVYLRNYQLLKNDSTIPCRGFSWWHNYNFYCYNSFWNFFLQHWNTELHETDT
jgi:hypothetical protein